MIIFLDEINFTKRSIQQRDWSRKNSNLAIDQEEIYVPYRSVIASMTEEHGIDHIAIYDSAITQDEFIRYLKALRSKHKRRPLALMMDQLAVHKGREVKPYYQQLNITPIYNVAYSP